MRYPLALLPIALVCLSAAARADAACPPGTGETSRPATPCLDRTEGRLWTPRLTWPERTREPPAALGQQMKALAALLQRHPEVERVRIEGHQDYDPARRVWGRCVSCDRARTLARLLIAEGVAADRLISEGYGEDRPLFDPRVADQNRLNARFEWHVDRFAPTPDRQALKTLVDRWRACFEAEKDAVGALAISLLLDGRGRLATVVLDRPGPIDCMTQAIGQRVSDGPGRISWPAADRPTPFPPPPVPAPSVPGRACADDIVEHTRPPKACVSLDGTRIWLPPMPRHPKSNTLPPKAFPVADGLVELLDAAPQIARIRIEMHDYRDPDARERARCHSCTRAQVLGRYLIDHGIDPARLQMVGHHPGRPAAGRPEDGPPRYEVHVEGWMMPEKRDTPAPPDQGEDGASTGSKDAEGIERAPTGKSRRAPGP